MSTAPAPADPWNRRRLLRTVLLVALAGLALLGGFGYAVRSAVTSAERSDPGPAPAAQAAGHLTAGQPRRDAIAAAPMLAVAPEASRSGTPAASPAATITVPPAGKVGPARVPTGFGHTPEGALGQLAAIEATVLQGMSIDQAHAVHQAWSTPGSGPADSWALVANIQAFLAAAGHHASEGTTGVVTTPVAAQVKGTDGPDWVLACVLLDVKARLATQARIAYGHCERMQWTAGDEGRWVIAAGTAPARAPSTWPGTDLARQAGWRTWVTGPDQP